MICGFFATFSPKFEENSRVGGADRVPEELRGRGVHLRLQHAPGPERLAAAGLSGRALRERHQPGPHLNRSFFFPQFFGTLHIFSL